MPEVGLASESTGCSGAAATVTSRKSAGTSSASSTEEEEEEEEEEGEEGGEEAEDEEANVRLTLLTSSKSVLLLQLCATEPCAPTRSTTWQTVPRHGGDEALCSPSLPSTSKSLACGTSVRGEPPTATRSAPPGSAVTTIGAPTSRCERAKRCHIEPARHAVEKPPSVVCMSPRGVVRARK